MTDNTLIRRIARTDGVSVSLFNDMGEYASTNRIETLVQSLTGARIRWYFGRAIVNISPFTKIAIHKGRSIWAVFNIEPTYMDGATDIEVRYV